MIETMHHARTAKDQLRRRLLDQRRALGSQRARQLSAMISDRLLAWSPFLHFDVVLSYVDSKDQEVATRPLLAQLLRSKKTVLVPVMAPGHTLRWSHLEHLEDLVPGPFGILEPRKETQHFETPPAVSCCLTPGVAFSRSGARIGYGGGYYDRFLQGYQGLSIGLAYAFQICPELPQEAEDIPLAACVSEDQVLTFKPFSEIKFS